MTINQYINNFAATNEQSLIESLIIESIQFYGMDMYYVPRVLNKYDPIYGADDQSSYEQAFTLEMYIKNVDGFQGDGNFMSKFGLEIRDQVTFSMARSRFLTEVGAHTSQPRPNEGDLIYFPLNKKCFQIKFVNNYEMYYQVGALQTWEVTCELFEYSGENFSTGIPEIDALQKFDTNQFAWAVRDENGNMITDEFGNIIISESGDIEQVAVGSNNEDFVREANTFIDWSTTDPFSEGI